MLEYTLLASQCDTRCHETAVTSEHYLSTHWAVIVQVVLVERDVYSR
jgi:hypothetical protein